MGSADMKEDLQKANPYHEATPNEQPLIPAFSPYEGEKENLSLGMEQANVLDFRRPSRRTRQTRPTCPTSPTTTSMNQSQETQPKQPRAKRPRRISRAAAQKRLLKLLAETALNTAEVEKQFEMHPAPEIETLLKLHRVLIFELLQKAEDDQANFARIRDLLKPVLDRLREEQRQLAQGQRSGDDKSGGLQEQTIQHIELQTHLL